MNGLSLSARDRRTLLVGAIVVGTLLLVFRGIPAWRRWDAGTRSSAAELVDAAARARAESRALPAALDSIDARQKRLIALAPRVLDGKTPAAAGATLAGIVSGAAARAGVSIGSVQIQPDTASAGPMFVRVFVRGDATGDLPGITRMLALLEGGPELLDVREVSITQPDAGGPADRPESLRLEFTVDGIAVARHTADPGDTARADDDASADDAGASGGGAGSIASSGGTGSSLQTGAADASRSAGGLRSIDGAGSSLGAGSTAARSGGGRPSPGANPSAANPSAGFPSAANRSATERSTSAGRRSGARIRSAIRRPSAETAGRGGAGGAR